MPEINVIRAVKATGDLTPDDLAKALDNALEEAGGSASSFIFMVFGQKDENDEIPTGVSARVNAESILMASEALMIVSRQFFNTEEKS